MEPQELIGKTASYVYGNLQGKIVDSWKLTEKITLIKIDCGDSTTATLNVEIVEIKE